MSSSTGRGAVPPRYPVGLLASAMQVFAFSMQTLSPFKRCGHPCVFVEHAWRRYLLEASTRRHGMDFRRDAAVTQCVRGGPRDPCLVAQSASVAEAQVGQPPRRTGGCLHEL